MNKLSIRWKLLSLGIILPVALAVILFAGYYADAKQKTLEAFVSKARAICLTTESTRDVMEEKWRLGIYSAGVLKAWAAIGDTEKILASVPVVNAWRAAMKFFQDAIVPSTGASARPARIDAAIIIPAVASPWMTSQAPSPRIEDCSKNLSGLENAPLLVAISLTPC